MLWAVISCRVGFIGIVVVAAACGEADQRPSHRYSPDAASDARPDDPDAPPEPTTFLAFTRDFVDFRTWKAFIVPDSAQPLVPAPHDDGGAEDTDAATSHVTGPRTVFINQTPHRRATRFPVGTIIVKAMTGSPDLFAMVKRGTDYNKKGAVGWEWFRLSINRENAPVILWRGITPPAGDFYGGASGGTCNECHGSAQTNDFVHSLALQAAAFTGPK